MKKISLLIVIMCVALSAVPRDVSAARIMMYSNDTYTVSNSNNTVFGSSENETITIGAVNINNVLIDQNIERINFPFASSDFAFKQTGNLISIYDATGTTLIVRVAIQDDNDYTLLSFSDGLTTASIAGGIIKLGGVLVSSSSPNTIVPTFQ